MGTYSLMKSANCFILLLLACTANMQGNYTCNVHVNINSTSSLLPCSSFCLSLAPSVEEREASRGERTGCIVRRGERTNHIVSGGERTGCIVSGGERTGCIAVEERELAA